MLNGKLGKRVLITGATGFVGSHMADLLLMNDASIFATKRWHHSSMENLRGVENKISWLDCDLTDSISTHYMMDKVRPDEIYHFAAESFVSPSWLHPKQYMRANYDATVNLLESITRLKLETRILIPGSGEEYGDVSEDDLPIISQTLLRPVNPYAVTKIAQDLIGYVYFRSYGTNVIRTRSFNHEGPRRPNVFGISSYSYQIARIEANTSNKEPVILIGHVDDKRNFTHVFDMVRAYQLAMGCCNPGELYLVGTQDVHTFREAVVNLISMSKVKGIIYQQVPDFTRPTQVPRLVADCKPFAQLTGWKTKYTFDDILYDTLKYWRTNLGVIT